MKKQKYLINIAFVFVLMILTVSIILVALRGVSKDKDKNSVVSEDTEVESDYDYDDDLLSVDEELLPVGVRLDEFKVLYTFETYLSINILDTNEVMDKSSLSTLFVSFPSTGCAPDEVELGCEEWLEGLVQKHCEFDYDGYYSLSEHDSTLTKVADFEGKYTSCNSRP